MWKYITWRIQITNMFEGNCNMLRDILWIKKISHVFNIFLFEELIVHQHWQAWGMEERNGSDLQFLVGISGMTIL